MSRSEDECTAERPCEDCIEEFALKAPQVKYDRCGGCGAENPRQRCIGCLHDFGHGETGLRAEVSP